MKKTPRKKKPISAEAIARMADQGKDIRRFFTGGRMMNPIQRVNVDFTGEMLEELDQEAADLNISRQAVIKTLVREGLDRRYSQERVSGSTARRYRRGHFRRTVKG
jgi:Ribbon-helix-helix protein, copG family